MSGLYILIYMQVYLGPLNRTTTLFVLLIVISFMLPITSIRIAQAQSLEPAMPPPVSPNVGPMANETGGPMANGPESNSTGFGQQQPTNTTGFRQDGSNTGFGQQQPTNTTGFGQQQPTNTTGFGQQQPTNTTGFGQPQQPPPTNNTGFGQPQQPPPTNNTGFGQPQQPPPTNNTGFGQPQQPPPTNNTGFGQPPPTNNTGNTPQQVRDDLNLFRLMLQEQHFSQGTNNTKIPHYCSSCDDNIYLGSGDNASMILAGHNRERAALGVAPLVWNNEMAARAQDWVNYNFAHGTFTHCIFVKGWEQIESCTHQEEIGRAHV